MGIVRSFTRSLLTLSVFGDTPSLLNYSNQLIPVDYYTVFSELEAQLADEFDFINEAQAMERIGDTLSTFMGGAAQSSSSSASGSAPLVTPRPVYYHPPSSGQGGSSDTDGKGELLGTRRVLVMDYLEGLPLTRALDAMRQKGIDPAGPEAKLFGRKLVRTLTEAFGVSILLDG